MLVRKSRRKLSFCIFDVVQPSENTPFTAVILARLITKLTGKSLGAYLQCSAVQRRAVQRHTDNGRPFVSCAPVWLLASVLPMPRAGSYHPPCACPCVAYESSGDEALPAGVFNVVLGAGEPGAALSSHPGVSKIAFTGSVPTGSAVMKACAAGIKNVTLELGGKSAMIIFDDLSDAELARAAEWCVAQCMQGGVHSHMHMHTHGVALCLLDCAFLR